MKRKSLTISLLMAALAITAQPITAQPLQGLSAFTSLNAAAPDPGQQVRAMARMLRNNDLAGLLQAGIPPATYAKMRAAFELHRSTPSTEAERAEFTEKFTKLAAPDAVDKFMLEIEPKLVEARPKATGAVMIGLGAIQMALNSDDAKLTDAQRASLQAAFPGIQRWATSTDFLSSISMRQAATLIADAARSTGIDSIEEFKALSFEQATAKASTLLAAAKQAASIYGFDLNTIADSMQVEVLAVEGDQARVRTTVTVFDAPIFADLELVLIDGRWYAKKAAQRHQPKKPAEKLTS